MPMSAYTPTIGLEIHAELSTKSKMFCGCKNDPHEGKQNEHTCPVCLAHPGTLPRVNREAVKRVLLIGEALGGEQASYSEFDRKNYFYPDIPKAYQLSQYAYPFVKGGELVGVAITRVHLEEDTARSQHVNEHSVVDFNRAGVPLMELVTEPVIHDAKTAGRFARELQLLLRTLGVSRADMEKGEMRVEANISISSSDKLGTKVEVKNLNSFRSVERAIEFEISRQAEILKNGNVILQETRGWDENKGRTFSQRTKETSEDYRYFPDPDIPKYKLATVDEFQSENLTSQMPKLPSVLRTEWLVLGLNERQIEILLQNDALKSFFDACVSVFGGDPLKVRVAGNYLTSDLAGQLSEDGKKKLDKDNAPLFAKLIDMVTGGKITSRVAKDLLPEVVFEAADPTFLAEKRGLIQQSDVSELKPLIEKIIADNKTVAEEYKKGKEAALQYLIGQAMKETKGKANPGVLAGLFKKELV